MENDIPMEREPDAPFNMAIATLERLDTILQQLRNNSFMINAALIDRQAVKISLTQQFFLNAIPLLKEKYVEKHKKDILNLKLTKKAGIRSGTQGINTVYDQELDVELDEILIAMQLKLQKYFMPSKGQALF